MFDAPTDLELIARHHRRERTRPTASGTGRGRRQRRQDRIDTPSRQ